MAHTVAEQVRTYLAVLTPDVRRYLKQILGIVREFPAWRKCGPPLQGRSADKAHRGMCRITDESGGAK